MRRYIIFALLGVSCAYGVAVGQTPRDSQTGNQQKQARSQQPAADSTRTPPVPERRETPEINRVEPGLYQPDCREPKDHPQADLCVQRRVAEAAENTLGLTQVQTVVGTIGLVLVLLSLSYSRTAARAAVIAAEAAKISAEATGRQAAGVETSLDIAKEATRFAAQSATAARDSADAVRQIERAHVWVRHVEITGMSEHPNAPLIVKLTITNSGRTPAFVQRIPLGLSFRDIRSDWMEFPRDLPESDERRLFIPPGESRDSTPIPLDIKVPVDQKPHLVAGIAYAVAFGLIEFHDIFEDTYMAGFGYTVFFDHAGASSCEPLLPASLLAIREKAKRDWPVCSA